MKAKQYEVADVDHPTTWSINGVIHLNADKNTRTSVMPDTLMIRVT